MSPPNVTWRDIITQAAVQPDMLKQPDVMRNVQNILLTNISVASSLGHPFLSQIQLIYIDMLNLYKCGPRPARLQRRVLPNELHTSVTAGRVRGMAVSHART